MIQRLIIILCFSSIASASDLGDEYCRGYPDPCPCQLTSKYDATIERFVRAELDKAQIKHQDFKIRFSNTYAIETEKERAIYVPYVYLKTLFEEFERQINSTSDIKKLESAMRENNFVRDIYNNNKQLLDLLETKHDFYKLQIECMKELRFAYNLARWNIAYLVIKNLNFASKNLKFQEYKVKLSWLDMALFCTAIGSGLSSIVDLSNNSSPISTTIFCVSTVARLASP
jgi:hypothetical protein